MNVLTIDQFLLSESGAQAKTELQRMLDNPGYRTITSYDIIVGRPAPFVDRHLNYLAAHPYIKPASYLCNLKVMLKIRPA